MSRRRLKPDAAAGGIPPSEGMLAPEHGIVPTDGLIDVPGETELVRDLAIAVGEADSLDDAFEVVLRRLCTATGWTVGQAWAPDHEGTELVCSPAAYVASDRFDPFREASRAQRFPPGVGLLGRVWQSGSPAWILDVRTDLNFPRAKVAADVGLAAGMAVPVLARGKTVAVLEFFVLERHERDAHLLELVSAAAAQLGPVVRRRHAEESARLSEERFRAVAETARDAIVSADEHGAITFLNQAASETFGYPRDELLGRPLTVLMPQKFREAHRAGIARYKATGDPHVIGRGAVELEGRRKNGEEFPIELSLATWTSGGRAFFTGIIREITERKAAEEELKRLYGLKSEFIAKAAHELRTPLTILSGFATTLAERRDELTDRQITEFFEILRFQGQRVEGLVEGLLDIARIEQESPLESLTPVLLEQLVAGALLAAPAPEGWEVVADIPADLAARAEPERLERVLVNLLVNAYRYGNGPVRVTGRADGDRVRLEVTDQGTGVPDDVAPQLFEPFARGREVQNIQGSGLGLAIVRQLLELMGGEISYEGTAGTRFVISLAR